MESGIPLVVLGRPFQGNKVSYVDIDNIESVESAVDYLINAGHKRIGTITGPLNTTVGIDRKKGYENSLQKHSLPIDKSLIVEGTFTEESGYSGMKKLLPAKPDAIFAASDQMALGAMRAIYEVGLDIPKDISIIGFDDFPLVSPARPSLTTLRQPIGQFGSEALKVLIEIVENGLEPSRQVILKSELIIRDSTRNRQ